MKDKLRILAAGDLHGNFNIAKRLSVLAKKEGADIIILAGDIYGYEKGRSGILDSFKKARQKVLFVPGNCDFDEDIAKVGHGKNIHNYYAIYNGVGIVGIGSPNWKLKLDANDFTSIKENLSRIKSSKKILVSHLHASGTAAEFSGIQGDKILRRAVNGTKPDLLISAHIHEGEGIEDVIGKTRVVQVGKHGTILDI